MASVGHKLVSGLAQSTAGFWTLESHFRQVRRAERLHYTPLFAWVLTVCAIKNAENN